MWFTYLNDVFFFQAEDGIRYLVRSRGLGDVYKRQGNADAALLDEARKLHREAQYMWDIVSAENSTGFHLSLIHI